MSGIIFLKTMMLDQVTQFYKERLQFEEWMNQNDCRILRYGNLLLGFCQRDEADTSGLVTIFCQSQGAVDGYYDRLKNVARERPKHNDKYNIYHFFGTDPEKRTFEVQFFLDPVSRFRCGDDLLRTRRSIRRFLPESVPESLLNNVFELSRFAPTSHNNQGYYFKPIADRDILAKLSQLRGSSSAPIARAPMAVAICSDPDKSRRHIQDGCIAAYHFLLAAWHYGLGTCWIAAMDKPEVKELLGVPDTHYIATITPLGFPSGKALQMPERRELGWFVRR
jgi:nitroreductase